MGKWRAKGLALALTIAVVLAARGPVPSSAQGGGDVESLLARLSPAERVGQLFLVGFPGTTAGPDSEIAQLIQQYHIGGVVLTAGNQGQVEEGAEPTDVQTLVSALQTLAMTPPQAVQPTPTSEPSGEPGTATPVAETAVPTTPRAMLPLFVAGSREQIGWLLGDTGIGPTLSAMTVGATWSTTDAEALGALEGSGLEAIGVNMLFGPPLDLANPRRAGLPGDLATDSFGESPFWVGALAQAYVRGLHAGSQDQVLAVAAHFPGLGAADRDVASEVPVVQDALSNRLQSDLMPFLQLAGPDSVGSTSTMDGLLITHMQYRNVTGNTQMARPISLDPQALDYVLSLPELQTWRATGGLLVSDSLGMLSIQRFYDPQLQTLQAKRIAYDAFLAGNDLLWLDSFSLTGDWEEHFANVRSTIEFFQAKYASDGSFRSRVDDSVRRILEAKQRLYERFSLDSVLPKGNGTAGDDTHEEVLQIANDGVTLVYPKPDELLSKIPNAPASSDRLVIFEDVREVTPCDTCPSAQVPISGTVTGLLRSLYGDQGNGQIDMAKVQSYTFDALWSYLEGNQEPEDVAVGDALAAADWCIFLTQGPGPSVPPQADALGRLLQEKDALIQGKRLVVLAAGAPYYLDSTDMAKLSAFYATYGASEPAIEAGLRALFRESTPRGISPVSVAGVGYVLADAVKPDPAQMLVVQPMGLPAIGSGGTLNIGLGDELTVATGAIRDYNGHNVPDGTTVVFQFSYAESQLSWQQEAPTVGGRAQTKIVLNTAGTLEVAVSSGEAKRSTTLAVTIRGGAPATVSTTVPSPEPTITAAPTPASVFPTPPESEVVEVVAPTGLDIYAFLLMFAGLSGLCMVVWAWGHQRGRGLLAAETAFLVFAAGTVAYLAYGITASALEKVPLLESGVWGGLSWRWQAALAAWIVGGAAAVALGAWPGLASRVVHALGRHRETSGSEP